MSATYADARRRILVANSDGLLAEDDAVRTRFGVNCVAVADTGMQTGYEAPGRSIGFEYFDEIDVDLPRPRDRQSAAFDFVKRRVLAALDRSLDRAVTMPDEVETRAAAGGGLWW